jgi:putative ABC transport system permease protein
MEILAIVSSLRRSKMAALLISLQVAVTLAVVSNALFIAFQQIGHMSRPSGVDEENIVSFTNVWTGEPTDIKARLQGDLAALRSLPGVQDAYATDSLPLRGGGYSSPLSRRPGERPGVTSTLYPVDEHGMHTLGLRLVAGRGFNSGDILDWTGDQSSPDHAPVIVITRALAAGLFPGGDALGKVVYIDQSPMTIIGIVERMQAAGVYARDETIENSALVPYLWAERAALYVIRAQPGQRDAVLQAAQRQLFQINRTRAITRQQSFVETRAEAYRPFRATALILSCVSVVLLAITALGVVGLTSFWVAQRRRQIGIRRALGARRIDILRYFHVENLVLVGAGAVIGFALAVGANLFIVSQFEMNRIPVTFVAGGIVLVLCLGQLSVLWPALRAAGVPPATAARA